MPTPPDRYHVHAPTRVGKPRRLHPRQLVAAPTADELRPHAATYAADALGAIRAALASDPTAITTRHLLPNRCGEAAAVIELLREHLHSLGAQVGALQRTRGTRQPYTTILWPAGWTVPASANAAESTACEQNDPQHPPACAGG